MLARWLLPNPYTVQHRILGLLYERVHLDEYLAGQNDIAAALNLPADKTIRHLNALRVGGYAQPDYEGNWMITEQGQRA
ncbi:MAG TPA: hypothetical protein VEY71_04675, partial [Chitinophagales bacterium]|nr:hypothetical protein [Chitinophagales bacterium]